MSYNNFKKNHQARRLINRFKTIREKIIRTKSAITFLIRCKNGGIIPKFISNSTKNIYNIFQMERTSKIQQNLAKYLEHLQNKILLLTLKQKHDILKHFQSELIMIKRHLRKYLREEEMEEFLKYEDKLATSFNEKVKNIHKKKFNILLDLKKKEFGFKLNDKWFVNKTDLTIPTDVQWLLSLGNKHSLPVRKEEFPILRIITEGEDFIQTIPEKEEQERARNKLTIMIDNHLNKIRLSNRDKFMLDKVHLTKKFLGNNKDILILKADKGNTTVALSRKDYDTRIENIVGDVTKYKLLNKDPTSRLQRTNNELVDELYRLGIITFLERNKLRTNVAIAPRIYGLPKIHKKDFPLRAICSFVNSPSYGLCKYVTNILKKLTEHSEYNVRDSLHFKSRIKDQHILDSEKLVSFDVMSLFPSIPVDLAMDIIQDKWTILEKHTKIEKFLFLRILKFCIGDNRYFQNNGNIYMQQEGLPMGSPASPIVADIVMEELLDNCIRKLNRKPRMMTKYVDDLFCIISGDEIDNMLGTLNNFNRSIKFTIETECNSKLPYLDTLLIRKGNDLLMDWYQKPTASGRILDYYSKHNRTIITNTARNLVNRILTISDKQFHRKNKIIIENILTDNNFPIDFIHRLFHQYKEKGEHVRVNVGEPKIYKSLTYIPQISERMKMSGLFDTKKYGIAFKTYNTVDQLFSRTKDKIQKCDRSNVVYGIPCSGNDREKCDKVYVGTTKNKLKTRIAGHKSDQRRRDNTNSQKTALSSHCSKLDHYPDFENVSVLNTEHNYKRRFILEMLHIINLPTTHRINFKSDTDNIAQNYRHLVNKK